LTFDEPLDWVAFGIWLSMLLHTRGADVYRVKGILRLRDAEAPVAVHGVRHLMHPPVHLPAWPGDDRQSHLVLIGRLPARASVIESLQAFGVLDTPAATQ
jgi:G3E family GTPase